MREEEPSSGTVAIVAASPAGLNAAREVAVRAGATVMTAQLLSSLRTEEIRSIGLDALFVSLEEDDPRIDGLLDYVDTIRRPTLVQFPPALTDIVARIGRNDVMLLCEPDTNPVMRAAELWTLLSIGLRVSDVVSDGNSERLRQLREDAHRLAKSLAELTDIRARMDSPPLRPVPSSAAADVDARAIRTIIRARRIRDQFFSPDLFADPAWDMLLDLAASRLERSPVAVSSLCIAAAVPATTALRWISRLVEDGLLVRKPDPRDGRRVFIELSDDAYLSIMACLHSMLEAFGARQ